MKAYDQLLPIFLLVITSACPVHSSADEKKSTGVKNATILIIRHAEKPERGTELSPRGEKRANAYVHYFTNFTIDSNPLRLDYLFATAKSKNSDRSLLTITPLSRALKLPIHHDFQDRQVKALSKALRSGEYDGKNILICWHHGETARLLHHLGADANTFLPDGEWPDDVFCWVILLRYDQNGNLLSQKSKVLNESLMPGDSNHKPIVHR